MSRRLPPASDRCGTSSPIRHEKGGPRVALLSSAAGLCPWATLVDARSSWCASACTAIFAAGVRRHYVGTQGLVDGTVEAKTARGLAYHEGGNPQSLQPLKYSGNATAAMIDLYYEFGSREAASLATLAMPNRLYVISGATALAKGIATGLGPP
ncbi:hypothetical protein [Alsobacter sp. R-9]